MRKKIDQELRDSVQAMYVAGEPATIIAQRLDLKVYSVRRLVERNGWSGLRKESVEAGDQAIVDAVAEKRAKKVLQQLDPLIDKLCSRAEALLDTNESLSSKDYLSNLVPMFKLKASLTSEVEENKSEGPGLGDIYAAMQNMNNEKFQKYMEESKASRVLIE